jgi:four helix bundle protein
VRSFREYRVWQEAHALTLAVYRVTKDFPASETYGLVSQMRRSSASIATNIAEGSVRSDTEFKHFLRIALGSASELEYQLILSNDLGYLSSEGFETLEGDVQAVKRMLTVFIRRAASTPADVAVRADGRRLTADGPSRGAL